MIGVYKITNPIGQIYVGSSINIKVRFYRHRSASAKNIKRLYDSLIKYGVKNHIMETIELCGVEILKDRERYWQEYYDVLNENGLNNEYVKTQTKQRILRKESLEKIQQSCIGRILSEEHKSKISKSNIGKKHSQLTKDKISNRHKGRRMTDSHKEKAIKNLKPENGKLVLDINTGIFYDTLKEAVKSTVYSNVYVSKMIRGKINNKTGLQYV